MGRAATQQISKVTLMRKSQLEASEYPTILSLISIKALMWKKNNNMFYHGGTDERRQSPVLEDTSFSSR